MYVGEANPLILPTFYIIEICFDNHDTNLKRMLEGPWSRKDRNSARRQDSGIQHQAEAARNQQSRIATGIQRWTRDTGIQRDTKDTLNAGPDAGH